MFFFIMSTIMLGSVAMASCMGRDCVFMWNTPVS